MNVEFRSIDYEEPRRSLLNLRISGDRGCSRCHLLYEACVGLHPFLEEYDALIIIRLLDSCGSVQFDFDTIGNASINAKDSLHSVDVYLDYLYNTAPPDWIDLTPYRKPLTCRQAQFRELLLDWLDDCEKSHTSCQGTNKLLPTRVVHVGEDRGNEPFLHVSRGEAGRYVALSHCWGEVLLIKTEKSNFSKHRNGIRYDTLPKNFQDAITVARAIGVDYIWIDSLCIIQDDALDWEIESSRMASIYQNAHVVLVASNSADSQGGLWNSAWGNSGQTNGVKELPYVNGDGSTSQIIARKTFSHADIIPESYLEYEAPSPLSKRAWTLQEELLASRCIFFTGKELLWKCQSATKCECMQEDNERAKGEIDRKTLWESAKSADSATRYGEWRSLMAYYSKRNITYESDRLPAISGLARYMQYNGAGEYLAGMWKEDLWESLLWLPRPVWRDVIHDNLASTYRRRASPYRAPTWSWMSL
ncbi:HET-domain-containing protein, partial [Hyaloscypha variabilis F]